MSLARWLGLGLVGAAIAASAGPAMAEDDCCKPALAAPAAANLETLGSAVFTDQRGHAVKLPDGRVWVVTFFYGHCKDVCPTLLYNLGSVAEALPAEVRAKVAFAGITFDPERDKVADLAQYQENYELTGDRYFLMTGDRPTLDRAFKSFKFTYKKDGDGSFQHVTLMAVMDGQGRIVRHFYGLQPNIEQVTALVTELVKGR
jgi:protein SCO1/2